jgi:MoxR-like ATPase
MDDNRIENNQWIERIISNINEVIVGKEEVIEQLIIALIANGHVLMDDVPGTGKTMLAKTFARSLDCQMKRVQFTPDLMPSDITGLNIYNQSTSSFELIRGPVFTNILLADEINRATPRTQSSLLESMEERQVTIDGVSYTLPELYMVIATQNPLEQQGTFPLPEAQLDRFLLKIGMGYPTMKEEDAILCRFTSSNPLNELMPVITPSEIITLRKQLAHIYVSPEVRQYMLSIVDKTRKHPDLACGVSPRASLQLYQACKARALIHGRNFMIPEDIKNLVKQVLTHRLIASNGFMDNSITASILDEILRQTAVPTESFDSIGL